MQTQRAYREGEFGGRGAAPSLRATADLKRDHLRNVKRLARTDRHVVILLGLYNGGRCLPEQLYSFKTQSHADWSLIVSDDGSTDTGPELVRCFARSEKLRDIRMIAGPRRGFSANFLHLLKTVDPAAPFVAFSDQDDAWLPGKLETAVARLATVAPGVPAVYCGRTWVCSRTLRKLRPSPHFRRAPSFRNAVVQSIGGGNTMVLNRAAIDAVLATTHAAEDIASHDWWAYQVVSGLGGEVIYDETPYVLYRQHEANVIGAGDTFAATLRRLVMLLGGRFQSWNDGNLRGLLAMRNRMPQENRNVLDAFVRMRTGGLGQRIREAMRFRIHHQTMLGNAGLALALLLRRL